MSPALVKDWTASTNLNPHFVTKQCRQEQLHNKYPQEETNEKIVPLLWAEQRNSMRHWMGGSHYFYWEISMETSLTFESHKYPQGMLSVWMGDQFKGSYGVLPLPNPPAKCTMCIMSAASYTFCEVSIVTWLTRDSCVAVLPTQWLACQVKIKAEWEQLCYQYFAGTLCNIAGQWMYHINNSCCDVQDVSTPVHPLLFPVCTIWPKLLWPLELLKQNLKFKVRY